MPEQTPHNIAHTRKAIPHKAIRHVLVALTALGMVGCEHRSPLPPQSAASSAQSAKAPAPLVSPPAFVDVSQEAGLHYRWTIVGKRPLNILQTIGNGCAFLDFNNDGNLDILLIGSEIALYRGDGKGHFTDVTHDAGLDKLKGHFLGCAVGDYDNDGFEDIYLTGYRGGILLHNDGGRRFRDVTREAGLTSQSWGTSAVFFDADADGKLDLYVGDYVEFGPKAQPQLCNNQGVMTGCGPTDYKPLRGVLYHNLGQGRFRDVTVAWGLNRVAGRTLGVAAAPFGSSSRPTLALANDETPSDLLLMRGAATEDIGVKSGMAYAGASVYGGMGIDWGDYDNDGRLDLAVATYQNQGKLIFRNQGAEFVVQDTALCGMLSSLPYVSFGVKWLDYDNDGWLDLLFANGHVQDNVDRVGVFGSPMGAVYRQPTVLYHNLHNGRFEDTSASLGADAGRPIVGRGVAIGDYDNDGRIDALVVDSEGAPLLLHNVAQHIGHWLELKLVGTRSNRDGIGALVTVRTGALRQVRLCQTGGSYLSASDRRVHVGIGNAADADISVRWPSGLTRSYGRVRADRSVTLRE